jgi:hypothetical protein
MQLKKLIPLMIFSLKLAVVLIIIAATATSQTPIRNLYAAGVSYNLNAQPNVAGTALYSHYVAGPGTYAFTVIDVLPTTVKPFTVTNNIGVGLAQSMFTIGRASLFIPTTAGISWNGTNTGWQWTGGAAVAIHLKDNFYLIPTARFLKSSVSGGSGYQPIFGLEFGWGK